MAVLKKVRKWTPGEKGMIEAKVDELRPWAYSFDFGEGLSTGQGNATDLRFNKVLKYLPEDLEGAGCIDLASNNGQLGMRLIDRGAGSVIAIDQRKQWIDQGRFLSELLGYPIEFSHMSVYDIPKGFGKFDHVFALGLIYHLQDLFRFFHTLYDLSRDACFIETEILRFDQTTTNHALFLEGRYRSDGGNWWVPGIGCVLGMARAAGFKTAEIIDYAPRADTVTREGHESQARGTFRFAVGEARLKAPRFERR